MKIKFKDYRKTIIKICKQYSKKYNVDYDDIYSQGCLLYCEALNQWISHKSKFNTYLNYFINRRMKNYIHKFYLQEKKFIINLNKINIDKNYIKPKYKISLFLDEINNDLSKKILKTVLYNPNEINNNIIEKYNGLKYRITMNKIRKYYIKKGYSLWNINQAIKLIQLKLKNI